MYYYTHLREHGAQGHSHELQLLAGKEPLSARFLHVYAITTFTCTTMYNIDNNDDIDNHIDACTHANHGMIHNTIVNDIL